MTLCVRACARVCVVGAHWADASCATHVLCARGWLTARLRVPAPVLRDWPAAGFRVGRGGLRVGWEPGSCGLLALAAAWPVIWPALRESTIQCTVQCSTVGISRRPGAGHHPQSTDAPADRMACHGSLSSISSGGSLPPPPSIGGSALGPLGAPGATLCFFSEACITAEGLTMRRLHSGAAGAAP